MEEVQRPPEERVKPLPKPVPVRIYPVKKMRTIAIACCLLAMLFYPIANRKLILARYPEFSAAFALVGIYNSNDLAIADVKMTKSTNEDKNLRIAIDCAIVNQAEVDRRAPQITAFLVDASHKRLKKAGALSEAGQKIAAGDSFPCKTLVLEMQEADAQTIELDMADKLDLLLRK